MARSALTTCNTSLPLADTAFGYEVVAVKLGNLVHQKFYSHFIESDVGNLSLFKNLLDFLLSLLAGV